MRKTECSFKASMKFRSRTVPSGANVRQPCSFTLSSFTLPAACWASPEQNSSKKIILMNNKMINFGSVYWCNCSSGYPLYCSGEQMRLQMAMHCHFRDHFSTLQDPQGSSTCTLRLVIDYGQAFITLTSLFCIWSPRSRMFIMLLCHIGLQIWLASTWF